MSDHEDAALDAIELTLRGLDRKHRPNRLRALMRLAGNALAAMTDNDEAGAVHTRLGREHFTRGTRR
jgi:hypothetical protein